MLGSYYQGEVYQNPVPYISPDVATPVPGWGVNPVSAGPSKIGIGAAQLPSRLAVSRAVSLPSMQSRSGESTALEETESEGLPTWAYYAIGAVVLVAAGAFAYQKGYLDKWIKE